MEGINGDRGLLVIQDGLSGLAHAFPTKSKHAEEVIMCVKLLNGGRQWNLRAIYSDMAGEFLSTMKQMHVIPRTSQPGISRSNAVAERAVRASLE
eukprot:9853826-Alexandrium_andersonii.AAC.1